MGKLEKRHVGALEAAAMLAIAVVVWASSTAGQPPGEACVEAHPFVATPAYSGRPAKLPALPTLANKAGMNGADLTVFGALLTLRSAELRPRLTTGDVTVVGSAGADPHETTPPCTKQRAWPTGRATCHLRLVDGDEHITVMVTKATRTSAAPPAEGDSIAVTGRYGPGYVVNDVVRYDAIWGFMEATELKAAGGAP